MSRNNIYKRFTIHVLVICICFVQSAVPQAKTLKTDDGYLLELFTSFVLYSRAKTNCQNRGGWLVRIKDTNMKQNVEELRSGITFHNANGDYYIGLKYEDSKWFWNDETELTVEQANWNGGEGDDSGQNCASLSRINGKWTDVGCGQIRRYICQSDFLLTTDTSELVVVEGESITVKLKIENNKAGKSEVKVYKLPDTTNALETISDVHNEATYTLPNIVESDQGMYVFVATPNGKSYDRSTTVNITVHVPVYIKSLYPKTITSPVTTGSNLVKCMTYGIPLPKVDWQINGTNVQTAKSKGVYQEKTSGGALLFVENAVLFDQGVYTCTAINYVGQGFQKITAQSNITLLVYGAPTITNYIAEECSVVGNVSITWRPNTQTIGINHRIEAVKVSSPVEITSTNMISNSEQLTMLDNVTSSTNYTIKITVCPDECITKLTTSIFVKTGIGLPRPVSNATVNVENKTCNINWTWSDEIPLANISFEIREASSLVYMPPDGQQNFDNIHIVEGGAFALGIETKPNRRYVFNITAKSCAGNSEGIRAVGECVTESAAPSNIITPAILDENGNTKNKAIRLSIPEETNGPISCIFVIMKSGEIIKNLSKFTQDQLDDAEKAANTNMSKEGIEYIAYAINRNTIDEAETRVIIGDGRTTKCNIDDTSKRVRRFIDNSTDEYGGKNLPLTNGVTYTYYIVTSTPTNTKGVQFGQSPPASFEYIYDEESNNYAWIAGLVIAILLIIFLSAAFYHTRKKRKKMIEQQDSSSDMQAPPEAPIYENLHDSEEDNQNNKSSTSIPIDKLKEYYEEMNENQGKKFSDEFTKLKQEAVTQQSTNCASQSFSTKKNRYKNILPFDITRVALEGDGEKSYINGSYIHGYSKTRKFIATQGPITTTVNDFWRMVVEKETKLIVMLTKCTEAGKKKCEKYWPDLGDILQYGAVSVSSDNEMSYGAYMKRTFTVTYGESKPHTIEQYHFMNWPDHGVPLTTSSFFRFYADCIEAYNDRDWPMIVHCSAGAGRTGAFIGFDYLLEEYRETQHIDIYECVLKMRQQRKEMVQTCEQYKLLHKLLLETHLFGNTDNDPKKIKEKLDEKGNKLIREEFTNLGVAASISKIVEQKGKGYDVTIRWVPEDGESIPRINAHRIETYDDAIRIIATESPTVSTVEYFWKAILDNDIDLLVMLNKEEKNSNFIQYWPSNEGQCGIFGKISVELLSSYSSGDFFERHFTVTNGARQKKITQYQILGWSLDSCPGDPSIVLNVLCRVHANSAIKPNSGILVHCNDGVGRTGVVCAIFNIVNRLKTENRADVFRAVKDLQDSRSEMIQNLDQYIFCYKAADAWSDCTDVENENHYENLGINRVERGIANESPYENSYDPSNNALS